MIQMHSFTNGALLHMRMEAGDLLDLHERQSKSSHANHFSIYAQYLSVKFEIPNPSSLTI